ncbi:hypothetical protein TWF730_005437 [Orbilia blumenaviensis]|uniref:Uncharacterized protein n=1 Tax=Orbilia blumenaviensis TaxID=1796055 RepID=A0AAV9VKK1_9PEZI
MECKTPSDKPDFTPGECIITLNLYRGSRIREAFIKLKLDMVFRISATIYDNGTPGKDITNPKDSKLQLCSGYGGEECRFKSIYLKDEVKVSPQLQRDYVQFYWGSQAWHTDPNPWDKGRKYVAGGDLNAYLNWNGPARGGWPTGPDMDSPRPWCDLFGGWDPMPKLKDNPDGGNFAYPFNGSDWATLETRSMRCWFMCDQSSFIDPKPSCPDFPVVDPSRDESLPGTIAPLSNVTSIGLAAPEPSGVSSASMAVIASAAPENTPTSQ